MSAISTSGDGLAAFVLAVDKFPQTTIWNELNAWGKSIADWQRYIVSHAVRDGTLSDSRIQEAYQLFLRDKKLDVGDEYLPEIPDSTTGRLAVEGKHLVLHGVKSLTNVNAIPRDSCLSFGPQMTIIYGHNGAGKSGFARVLSKACFGRSSPSLIRNIYDESADEAPATATFEVDRGNGGSEEVDYTDGDEHYDLKRVSVFDSSASRIHLAKENELGFQPAGFDVFEEAIRVVGLLGQKLEADIHLRTRQNKFTQLFADEGAVADRISSLTADSSIVEIRALATFADVEKDRLEEIARQEQELLAGSPIELLKSLASAKADIVTLQKKVRDLSQALGTEGADKSRRLLDSHKLALLEAVKAGSETVSHPELRQTGSGDWNNFVLASRNLGRAEAETYPSQGIPCLLCHRPLDAPSASLISRMWGYLDHDARKAAIVADDELNLYCDELKALDCALLPGESRIRSDLSKLRPSLIGDIDAISVTFEERRTLLVAALEQGANEAVPDREMVFTDRALGEALEHIVAQDAALRDGKFDQLLSELKAEHINLRQRQVLSKNIEDVVSFIADLAWIKKAGGSRPTTRFITDRQKIVFEKLIEGSYKNRLKEECDKLDCSLPYEFKARGSAGKTLRGLKAKGGHKPEEIFSEGEQRALSLADFLTEVNLNPASAAIILDDPVTSLDHKRKRAIAKRLAAEASVRQVIVFTHDLVFLTVLSDIAEGAGCEVVSHWIQNLDGVPGCVTVNDTPANSRVYKKTTKATDFLLRAKRATGGDRVDLIRSGAGALRRTLEETVLQHLFKDTVRRWDEQVRLGALTKIRWSDALADEIVALQDDTSRLLEGHSNSDEFAGDMPDVDALENLITRVNHVIEKAKGQR